MRAASYPLETTSAGVVGRAALADDGDLDPARIAHLALDRGGDLVRDQCRPLVVDLSRVDHHPHLAAGLHRIDLFHPGVAGGELLELAQASDIAFQGAAAGAWTGAREGIGRLHDHRLDRARLDLVVMGLDRVGHLLALAVATSARLSAGRSREPT